MPTLYWASSPARPNDTVLLTGSGLGSVTAVQVARLADGTPSLLAVDDPDFCSPQGTDENLAFTDESAIALPTPIPGVTYAAVKPLVVSATSVTFVIPSSLAIGVFSVYVTAGTAKSNTVLVNAAQGIWFQAKNGSGLNAWRGETVRLFGRCFGSLTALADDESLDDPQAPQFAAAHSNGLHRRHAPQTETGLGGDDYEMLGHISTDHDINSVAAAMMDAHVDGDQDQQGVDNRQDQQQQQQQQQGQSLLHRAVRRLTGAPLAEDEDRSLGGASATASASGDLRPPPIIPLSSGEPYIATAVTTSIDGPPAPHLVAPHDDHQQQQQQQQILQQQQSPLGREHWTLLDEHQSPRHPHHPSPQHFEHGEAAECADLWGVTAVAKFTPTATAQGKAVIVPLSSVTLLTASLTVPSSLATGKWKLSVHNGYGGNTAWGAFPDQINIVSPPARWKSTVFSVTKLGFTEALKQAGANGGGVVQFDVGRYTFNTAVTIPVNVIIKGAGANATSLVWNYTGSSPPSYMFLGTGLFAVSDITIYMNGMFSNMFRVQPGTSGCYFSNMRVRANPYINAYQGPKPPPTNAHLKTGNIFSCSGNDFAITGCDIYAPNFCFSFDSASNVLISGNTFLFGGQGYNLNSCKGIVIENNSIMGNTFTSTGNGMSSVSLSNTFKACERIYYNNNTHNSYYGNNREMMTLDGAGGAYYGKIASAKGTTVTLASDPKPTPPGMPDNVAKNWPGAVIVVLSGTGAGQLRRVTASSNRTWTIDSAFTVSPDTNSLISITFYRGDMLFVNNTFSDGGAVQLYGASFNCVMMGNKGYRIGGFSSWGLNPKSYCWQPSMYNLFINNVIAEGNAWATVTAAFFSIADAASPMPMVRFNVWRRNTINNNAAFSIGGPVEDSLFEMNTISNTPTAFVSSGSVGSCIVLRGNKLSACPTLVSGPGSTKFRKF